MKDRKNFISGIIIGVVAVIVLNSAGRGFYRLYTRYFGTTMDYETKIKEIYSILDEHYINSFDKDEIEQSMYQGLLYGLGDPYTSYMDPKTLASFMERTEGSYAGIGVVVEAVTDENSIRVVMPYEGCPGDKAGLQIDDRIIKINGSDVYGSGLDEAVNMIKGKPGTSVNVTIFRESEMKTFEIDITREQISVPTVSHKMLENDIGYLKITNFERVTYDQFMTAYNDLLSQNAKGLIIDVRNNPGGLLDTVCQIADELVPEGYIVYTEDKQGRREYINSDNSRINIPLLILVNENSASASEVLSGAVKDMGVGELVGAKTYGKGLVQSLYYLSDGSAIKTTIAKYYTPGGICINGEGIIPDYVVDLDTEKVRKLSVLTLEEDPQLQKAIEVMNQKIAG